MIQRFLKIDSRETEFARRGFFCADATIRMRLEKVGQVFLLGYHAALQEKNQIALALKLEQVEQEFRGFAYEGAAMALALLNGMGLRRNALSQFMAGPGRQHIYMLHVGAGWAYARLPWLRWRIEPVIKKLHPVLGWLAMDGCGFHEGYFHFKAQKKDPASGLSQVSGLSEDARHVFYQGLGRSLWFLYGADGKKISGCIRRFPLQYHGDAWSGIGLACAYAGGLAQDAVAELRNQAGSHAFAMAQGAAFAAKARQLAGNPAEHTDMACALLCQLTSEEAAALCDQTFAQIDLLQHCPYQHWRQLLQQSLIQKSISSSTSISPRGNSNESRISSSLVATEHR
ncbi:MAG TPA: DUF1702 family protein [Candidatus Angelobacter sp.]|nr:DUF1702 family protein [Candidatus Angelobacter sp.]